ncbi:hypothetical protein RDI58_017989 [Solanum bulbocastanum]|uniref:Polygalacturonase n=1 Tax=Solanum bulbocastanum TaxID=147425 RepID=A0AAN8TDC4_SOLBU
MASKSCLEIAFIFGLVLLCPNADGKVFNVLSYGAKADGVTDNSKTLGFNFVNNTIVRDVHSINSKNIHFKVFACENMTFSHVNITAPRDSPNTDGIHISHSTNIHVLDSYIGTGDDCIAIIAGSNNINISGVTCGPGHGISIGSLGNSPNEVVKDIHVKNCTLIATQNGLRIKTWASSNVGNITNITFEDIIMKKVRNPIFIDQHYCPRQHCSKQRAVILDCSALFPCEKIILNDINLAYHGHHGHVIAFCAHAKGKATGKELPPSCLKESLNSST